MSGWRLLAAAVLISTTAQAALAQSAAPAPATTAPAADEKAAKAVKLLDRKAQSEGSFAFDYGVPASPALKLTGLSADKVNVQSSLKPFALALPDLFSKDGARTLAFDAAPGQLFTPAARQRYSSYVADDALPYRIGFRTRVGLALDRGQEKGSGAEDKGAASKLALGLSTSLLDQSDPLMATDGKGRRIWESCVAENLGTFEPVVAQSVEAQRRTLAQDDLAVAQTLKLRAGPVGERQYTPAISADIARIEAALNRLRAQHAPAPAAADQATEQMLRQMEARAAQLSGAERDAVLQAMAILRQNPPPSDAKPIRAPDFTTAAFDPWLEAARTSLQAELDGLPAPPTEDDEATTIRTKALKECAVKASEKAQISPDLDLGFGSVWSGSEGKLESFKKPAPVLWASFRLPLRGLFGAPTEQVDADHPPEPGHYWTIGVAGRYAWGDMLATGDDALPKVKADVSDVWVGLERLTTSSRFAIQYGWADASAKQADQGQFSRSGDRWLVSGAFKLESINEGLWLTFSYGKADSTIEKFDDEVALVSLTYSPPTLSSMFKGD